MGVEGESAYWGRNSKLGSDDNWGWETESNTDRKKFIRLGTLHYYYVQKQRHLVHVCGTHTHCKSILCTCAGHTHCKSILCTCAGHTHCKSISNMSLQMHDKIARLAVVSMSFWNASNEFRCPFIGRTGCAGLSQHTATCHVTDDAALWGDGRL